MEHSDAKKCVVNNDLDGKHRENQTNRSGVICIAASIEASFSIRPPDEMQEIQCPD